MVRWRRVLSLMRSRLLDSGGKISDAKNTRRRILTEETKVAGVDNCMGVCVACKIIERRKTASYVCDAENAAICGVEDLCVGVYLVLVSVGRHVGRRKPRSAFSGPASPKASMAALALSDSLLASSLSLPPNLAVVYRRLSPNPRASPRKPYDQIELVRQHLLTLNASESLLHSLLASVRIGAPHPSIYVFAISSCDQATAAAGKIQDLHFDYMTGASLG